MNDIIISIIGVLGIISSILFAYLAFRRNDSNDVKNQSQKEGKLLSDISYIKSSIDRMESKLDNVENNYQSLLVRIIKLENRVKEE